MKVSNQTRRELRMILGVILLVILGSMVVAFNNSQMEFCENRGGTPQTGLFSMYRDCEGDR